MLMDLVEDEKEIEPYGMYDLEPHQAFFFLNQVLKHSTGAAALKRRLPDGGGGHVREATAGLLGPRQAL